MASKMIGVEIGSSTLKMAVSVGGTIKTMAVKRMPEDLVREGKITAPAAMVQFLTEMRKENGIRPGPCALVLPSQVVIGHQVTMPVMSESELMLNLPFEFRDFVGKDGAKYDYDYSVMNVKDGVMELYAAAVRKSVVEEYYSVFKKAGLTLKIATPAEMAWLNLVRSKKNAPNKLCIVDMGHNITRVNIFSDGNFVMGQDIEMAGSLVDETIASTERIDPYVARTHKEANLNNVLTTEYCIDAYQTLVIEIMKILNFYVYSAQDGGALQDVYYCGGTAVIEPLRNTLLKGTGMTLHHLNRLVPMLEDDEDQALYCALAAGAAIQN